MCGLEADIEACFDSIDHTALLERVRRRIKDKRVLRLIKAFLKAGILTELGREEETPTGTPQGGILSPLLSNIALSVLGPLGLRLSAEKTRVVHLDEGFDFLGFTIRRRRKRGTGEHHVYTYPSKKALCAVKTQVLRLTIGSSTTPPWLVVYRINAVLRGWAAYFRHGVSKRTFSYLDSFAWRRVTRWLRKRHAGIGWRALRRRFMRGWDIVVGGVTLFMPSRTPVTRYRYRGSRIPTPWSGATLITN